MKALSVRAPWWWFILHGGKDIENRDWPTRFRGTIYLHASRWCAWDRVIEDWCWVNATILPRGWHAPQVVTREVLRASCGCLVGKVDIVDCVSQSNSPWFFGKYGFVLANPIAFVRPIPCRGALGFFDVPADVGEAARRCGDEMRIG